MDPKMMEAARGLQVVMGDPMVADGGLDAIGPTGLITGFIALECVHADDGQMFVKVQLRGPQGDPLLVEWEHPLPVYHGRTITLPFHVGVTVQLMGGSDDGR